MFTFKMVKIKGAFVFISNLKEKISKRQDEMYHVSICIPFLLPVDRDKNLFEKLKEVEDTVDECEAALSGIADYKIAPSELAENIDKICYQADIFISAAKKDNLNILHDDYDDFVDNYFGDDKSKLLLHKKGVIYDIFLDNVSTLTHS